MTSLQRQSAATTDLAARGGKSHEYVEHRPDRRFIELQTHPLLIPDKIDSWIAATVL